MPGRRPDGGWWHEPSRRLPGKGAIRGRAPFGATWWGRAWIDALEHRARLDSNRLPRGRTYARGGAVEQIEIGKGRVTAFVQGSRPTPYKVSIGVHQFTGAEWESVFDALSAEVGRAAALLDGELPTEIADELRDLGLDLLPGPGSLEPRCSCPDRADPCKHAAAVCYLVSDSLDEDPFALFLMRGRSRAELMSALRARRAAGMRATPGDEAGRRALPDERPQTIRPSEAWGRRLEALPVLPLPPPRLATRPCSPLIHRPAVASRQPG